ncbi:hypothetical protein CONCODRAFT_13482, partial [Conidiobolus coronatus NRRL 28638]
QQKPQQNEQKNNPARKQPARASFDSDKSKGISKQNSNTKHNLKAAQPTIINPRQPTRVFKPDIISMRPGTPVYRNPASIKMAQNVKAGPIQPAKATKPNTTKPNTNKPNTNKPNTNPTTNPKKNTNDPKKQSSRPATNPHNEYNHSELSNSTQNYKGSNALVKDEMPKNSCRKVRESRQMRVNDLKKRVDCTRRKFAAMRLSEALTRVSIIHATTKNNSKIDTLAQSVECGLEEKAKNDHEFFKKFIIDKKNTELLDDKKYTAFGAVHNGDYWVMTIGED